MLVARFLGVDWRIHPLFLLLLLVLSLSGYLPQAMVLVVTLLCHELAHVTAAVLHGLPPGRIDVFPFGGIAEIAGIEQVKAEDDVAVAAAGPLGNLMLIALATLLQDWRIWNPALMDLFVGTNLAMAVLNLLPVLPLDGGRVVRALVARHVGYRRATAVLARTGRGAGYALVLAAAWVVYAHWPSPPVTVWVTGVNAAFLGLFIVLGSRREEVVSLYAPWQALITRLRLLQMRRLLPVCELAGAADLPVTAVISHLRPGCVHRILVIGQNGEHLGVLTEEDLLRGLQLGADVPLRRLLG